jgi:hypothetical protein
VRLTVLVLDTSVVVMLKTAVNPPSPTVTVPGTLATDGLELDRETTAPPGGAGPFRITDPVELNPPTTVEGSTETDDSDGGFTVRLADFSTPPYEALTLAAVEEDTGRVVTAKVALVAPDGTVTDVGTSAAEGLPLESETTAPPALAGPSSVTVPVEPFPPTTEDGVKEREASVTGIS